MTGPPREYSFLRYLEAKKGLDHRSLNRHVWETLAGELSARPAGPPCRVLEVGCGLGAMLERLLDWRLLPAAVYSGIDLNPECIAAARDRFRRLAAHRGADLTQKDGRFRFRQAGLSLSVDFAALDFFRFLVREQGRRRWDLILAHAFLDLVDLDAVLPGLLSLLTPGGLFYFTLNFDGSTIFTPTTDPELDRLIESLYHNTMDRRRVDGRPSGSSRTGRLLFERLRAAGATVLAAGSSDWVVFPGPEGYPGDEAYFLHFIIHTIHQALEGHPGLPAAPFRAWVEERHAQIQRQELSYIAHQLDFCGRV
jgi:SAM-dependent methyltransferase